MGNTHRTTALEILSRWPSRRDVSEDTGASLTAVHRWFIRNRIPAEYDTRLIDAARRRDISLTYAELAETRAQEDAA